MEERFRAKGIHISWMGGQGATIPRISQLYDRLYIVFCRIFVAFWMSLKKPCWLNQVIFISLQTQMHSREPVTAGQMNLKSTKELFVCRIACWSYSRWCCCACLFAFFWIAIFCLLTMGIQRQSYIIHGNWIEFHRDFDRNVGVNLATVRFNKSTQTFSQHKLDGLPWSQWLCSVKPQ